MKTRDHALRAQRILDRLDERCEEQTMADGADNPHCVGMIAQYEDCAGSIDRMIARQNTPLHRLAFEFRGLRGILRQHEEQCESRCRCCGRYDGGVGECERCA